MFQYLLDPPLLWALCHLMSVFIKHLPRVVHRDAVLNRTDKTHSYRRKSGGKWERTNATWGATFHVRGSQWEGEIGGLL